MSLCQQVSRANTVAILRYHAIVEEKNNFYADPSICLSPHLFEDQVKYITKAYNIISLDKVAECLIKKKPFPKKAVVLTFDDGYKDNFIAYKIMKKYGAFGTFYVAAGCIGNNEPLWLFEVIYLIGKTARKQVVIEFSNIKLDFPLHTEEDRRYAVNKITEKIKSNNLQTREDIRSQLHTQLNDVPDLHEKSKQVMLTWKQVQEMVDNGMDIGGHTMTHLNLPNASSDNAFREITDCKKLIEEKTGHEVHHFSYPNGGNYDYYNNTIIDFVKDAGFLTSTTSHNGLANSKSNRFELQRIRITSNISEIVYQINCENLVKKVCLTNKSD